MSYRICSKLKLYERHSQFTRGDHTARRRTRLAGLPRSTVDQTTTPLAFAGLILSVIGRRSERWPRPDPLRTTSRGRPRPRSSGTEVLDVVNALGHRPRRAGHPTSDGGASRTIIECGQYLSAGERLRSYEYGVEG